MVASGSAAAEPPGTDEHGHAHGPAAAVSKAAGVALRFARAWVRRDLDAAGWHRNIAALCQPRFAEVLRTVDPVEIPAGKVTGKPTAERKPRNGAATYSVPTDGGVLTVELVDVDGRWLVAGNDFRRQP